MLAKLRREWFAIGTIAKINTKAYFRNRTALFFTLFFPLIFLVVFGSLFGKSNVSFKTAIINQSDTSFAKSLTQQLDSNKLFKVDPKTTTLQDATTKMDHGQLDATIIFPPGFGKLSDAGYPTGTVEVYSNPADQQTGQALSSVLNGIFSDINTKLTKTNPPISVATKSTKSTPISPFDYIFSGMLGFAIIGIGIFGPTNAFPEMKKDGVLRRMRTTPITAAEFIIGNVLSYLFVGILSVVVLFVVAKLFFHLDFHGSYASFSAIAILGIITIFGFGMAVGGWARDVQQAAPLSNIVAFPMMFLSGTFFPTFLMPEWLQKIAHFLPLTPIIDSLRFIVTGDRTLLQLGPQLGLIGLWVVVIYFIAFRVFRWE